MRIERFFTLDYHDPYDGIEFKSFRFGKNGAEYSAPSTWRRESVAQLFEGYALKNAVPNYLTPVEEPGLPEWLFRHQLDETALSEQTENDDAHFSSERDARQLFDRMAGHWTYSGWRAGYFSDDEAIARIFFDELRYLLAHQLWAPSAEHWRFLGLYWAYGIEGGSDSVFYAKDSASENWIESQANIQFPFALVGNLGSDAYIDDKDPAYPDALDAILRSRQAIRAFVSGLKQQKKHFETIFNACQRAAGSDKQRFDPRHNSALAKALSQALDDGLEPYDLRETLAQARMGQLSMAWLDQISDEVLFDFARQELNLAQGASPFGVSHILAQNAKQDTAWHFQSDDDGTKARQLASRQIWDQLIGAAYADPDVKLVFSDSWRAWQVDGCEQNKDTEGEWVANAEGEPKFAMAVFRLGAFRRSRKDFDLDAFSQAIRLAVIALDISHELAGYADLQTAQQHAERRELQLGISDLAGLLMSCGLAFDSEEARATGAMLAAYLHATASQVSAELAQQFEPVAGFEKRKADLLRRLEWQLLALQGSADPDEFGPELERLPAAIQSKNCFFDHLTESVQHRFEKARSALKSCGLRHSKLTGIVEHNELAWLLGCESVGAAPMYNVLKLRHNDEGGALRQLSPAAKLAVKELGLDNEQGENVARYVAGHLRLGEQSSISPTVLLGKGLTQHELNAINNALAGAMSLEKAISPEVLGFGFCHDILGLSLEQMVQPDFSLLYFLGFSEDDIAKAEAFIFGHLTFEGAPGISERDLGAFDAILHAAGDPERCVSPSAQIAMFAQLQPFLSGVVAQPILVPEASMLSTFSDWVHNAWASGLHYLDLQRDGSDPTRQILCLGDDIFAEQSRWHLISHDEGREEQSASLKASYPIAPKVVERLVTAPVDRNKLPDRRKGYIQKAVVGGHKVYLHTGEFKNGELGEIFIDMHKEGAAFRSLMNNFAIAISIALQYGVPLEEFVDAFIFTRFEPAGPVSGNDSIKHATSILDYIFRELAVSYLGRDDLAHMVTSDDSIDGGIGHGVASEKSEGAARLANPEDFISRGFSRGKTPENIIFLKDRQSKTKEKSSSDDPPAELSAKTKALESLESSKTVEAWPERDQQSYAGDPCPECGCFTVVQAAEQMLCESCGMQRSYSE